MLASFPPLFAAQGEELSFHHPFCFVKAEGRELKSLTGWSALSDAEKEDLTAKAAALPHPLLKGTPEEVVQQRAAIKAEFKTSPEGKDSMPPKKKKKSKKGDKGVKKKKAAVAPGEEKPSEWAAPKACLPTACLPPCQTNACFLLPPLPPLPPAPSLTHSPPFPSPACPHQRRRTRSCASKRRARQPLRQPRPPLPLAPQPPCSPPW